MARYIPLTNKGAYAHQYDRILIRDELLHIISDKDYFITPAAINSDINLFLSLYGIPATPPVVIYSLHRNDFFRKRTALKNKLSRDLREYVKRSSAPADDLMLCNVRLPDLWYDQL